MTTPIGPKVKKLIAYKMALLLIPLGSADPFVTGMRAIAEPGKMSACGKEAAQWVQTALAAIKAAPDNPYGEDDEVIATELLRMIDERQGIKGHL